MLFDEDKTGFDRIQNGPVPTQEQNSRCSLDSRGAMMTKILPVAHRNKQTVEKSQ